MTDFHTSIDRRLVVRATRARRTAARIAALVFGFTALAAAAQPAATRPVRATPAASAAPVRGDHILAIVNQEVVTAGELEQRIARIREAAAQSKSALPPEPELRQQVLDLLIDERALLTHARDSGMRIDDAEVERAVNNVAVQNQVTLAELRERLKRDGVDFGRFRRNVRDQLMVERLREREVNSRIRVTEREIDALLDQRREAAGGDQLNIAQVYVAVPEGAAPAVVAERRARAQQALERLRRGEPFASVAEALSDDAGSKAKGGEFGLRPTDRLPDVFVGAVRGLKPGELAPTPLQTAAGFHVLKLVDRVSAATATVQQTLVRHILLRPSAQLSREAAVKRLADFKRRIASRAANFEQLARENSEDGSAPQGGDLGWVSPGALVPEFEAAMNDLPPGGVSDPVVSRFGVHLISVVDRRQTALDPKQVREQARLALREQKFEQAYSDWLRELRGQAYVELRDPPSVN